jgi:crotonobetainyl-CoA:carnitine CoA-transferase CaiB-like acyl-CoA transferase
VSGESSAGLAGVRVVDFGHYIAGPLAALLLAEAGADVVIENFRRGVGTRPAGRGGRVPAAEPAPGSPRAGF